MEEKEITVKVTISLEELLKILEKNKFEVKDEFDTHNIYMTNNHNPEDDLRKTIDECIILREIVLKDKIERKIIKKRKQYNDKNEIIKSVKRSCIIKSIEDAKSIFEDIGYYILKDIKMHNLIYVNNECELLLQIVKDKVYIEMENEFNFIKKKFDNIDEMIKLFDSYNIPIENNNYFVSKILREFE